MWVCVCLSLFQLKDTSPPPTINSKGNLIRNQMMEGEGGAKKSKEASVKGKLPLLSIQNCESAA